MRKIAALSIILFFFTAAPLTLVKAAVSERLYVPDEIIVKFRPITAEAIYNQLQSNASNSTISLSSDLQRLNRRFRVTEIIPLIRDFRRDHQYLNSLRDKDFRILTQKERNIVERNRRAPLDSDIPALGRIYRLKLDISSGESIEEVLEAYRTSPDIEYAELNYLINIESEPDDPRYPQQWALSKINASQAWDISTGSREIIVAVLDTGIDYNHRDIKNNVWANEAELNGIEGLDDDNNGYIDDIYGYNFLLDNNDVTDDNNHGTYCAGIIAAESNNGLDISGVCWNAKIMGLKFIGQTGTGNIADSVAAHYYAVANGADIISNSWSTDEDSQMLKEAVEYAYSQGVIVVAAAGNQGFDIPRYPAGYSTVISVTATDSDDEKWVNSNYGDLVDIAAPGVDIVSLNAAIYSNGQEYDSYTTFKSGTSSACPYAAGACALLLSTNPLLKQDQIYNILTRTSDPIIEGICFSNGRINLSKAMDVVVSSRAYISFDRDYYKDESTVGVLLSDRDLKGTGSHQISITTNSGDLEDLTLTESETAYGIFTGTILIDSGSPDISDGLLQCVSGGKITALYYDENTGTTNIESAEVADKAVIDFQPPRITDIRFDIQARHVTITFTTDELTGAEILYGPILGETIKKEDNVINTTHVIKLQPLNPETNYVLTINVFDLADNHTINDNEGMGYSITTLSDFQGLRVPEVYANIQAAIDDASDGDTIWVCDGIYTEDGNKYLDFKGKAITLKSENGPTNCIIDCQGEGRAFYFHSAEEPNSVLEGFTIINGSVAGGANGGAIICLGSSPTIKNCIISNNSAGQYGGGIFNAYQSNPVLIDCAFYGNHAGSSFYPTGSGGAICNLDNCNPTLTDCVFNENTAAQHGGGIYNEYNSNPSIYSCTFTDNSSQYGGAVCNYLNSSPVLTNCIFSLNSAEFGGAIYNNDSIPVIFNCTIVNNSSDLGAGIMSSPNGGCTLANCILWDNTDQYGSGQSAQIYDISSGLNSNVNYCCIQGLNGTLRGIGNIGSDPLFYNVQEGDYHLKSTAWRWDIKRERWHYDEITSPCVDAGCPSSLLDDETISLQDDPVSIWGINIRINMGAYGGTNRASMAPYDWSLLADLTNDGNVNMKDYAGMVLKHNGTEILQPGDLNHNNLIDNGDLLIFSQEWLNYVQPPEVEIISPEESEFYFDPQAEIKIEAQASDSNGEVVKVEFFANSVKIGQDTDGSDGWEFVWTDFNIGQYHLSARATDNAGVLATSEPVLLDIIPLP